MLLASSLITALGVVVPSLWFAVFPGLALFFFLLREKVQHVWAAALCGLLFGVVTGGAGTIWFLDTLPLSFLGIHDPIVQATAVGMTWAYVAVSLGLPVMLGAIPIWLVRSSPWFPLWTTFVWGITEIGRMWIFALTTWGPRSLFGPHFSPASVGYPLTESDILVRLAHPLGLDALTLCVAAGSAFLAVLFSIRRHPTPIRAFIISTSLTFLLVALPSLIAERPVSKGSTTLRFAVISEHIEEVRDFSTHYLVREKLAQAAAAHPPVDVIVLPEEFSLTSIFWSNAEASRFISDHFGEREVLILNTRNDLYPAEERNLHSESKKLVFDSTTRGEVGRYIKQMLMPLGEYAPAFTKTFFSLVDDPELHLYLEDVATGSSVSPHLQVGEFRGVRIGGLLCSDMLSPHLYRSLYLEHGAEVLVNLSNHFWFHGSKPLYWKTVQMARVHATQNQAPLLVSNNIAPSFVMDKQGKMIAEAPWGAREVLYVSVPIDRRS
jgi:apolipoprotein N-acyltransferase